MKILVLHGFSGNATWQQRKDWRLQKLISPLQATLHHVDGPILLEDSIGKSALMQRRCWWRANRRDNSENYMYGGWAETIAYLTDIFETEGPFDGVLGVSQGACCAAALAALVHAGAFSGGLRFAIIACGFVPRDPDILAYFPSNTEDQQSLIGVPTLHILGETDHVTPPDVNLALLAKFRNPTLVRHAGGHHMALDTQSSRAYLSFLRQYASEDGIAALEGLQIEEKELCQSCWNWWCSEAGRATETNDWYCDTCWAAWEESPTSGTRSYETSTWSSDEPPTIRRRGFEANPELENLDLQKAIEESLRSVPDAEVSNPSGGSSSPGVTLPECDQCTSNADSTAGASH